MEDLVRYLDDLSSQLTAEQCGRLKKGSTILPTFYRPATVDVVNIQEKGATIRVTYFPEPHPTLEARLGGWVEQGLIVCGCKAPKVIQTLSMSRGDRTTEYDISWR